MLRNYLKIAWRNLVRNKTYSILNIAGLAIGLSCFLLMALYVVDELSYDRHHKKADRLYRVNSDIRFGGTDQSLAVSPDPMGAALKRDYPQVEQFTRLYASNGAKVLRKGNQFITEYSVGHADSTIFEVFTLPAISGDTKTALNEPNTVVVTASAARKYFNSTDVLGKTIETDENAVYKITAVIEDMPRNGHFNFDFLFSMDNVDYQFGSFVSHNFHTYLLFREGTDVKAFEKNFDQYIDRYVLPQAKQFMDISSIEDFEKAGNKLKYSLMNVRDIHLNSDRVAELSVNSQMQYVYIFSAVAIFILLIACINFMNLSTARSANRAKEVGIRKVLGTEKKSLVQQFLAESTITAIISLVIGIVIAWAVLPYFNSLAAKSISIGELLRPEILSGLLALPFIVGAVAGSYPALYLSSFKPIAVLKGKINAGFKRSYLRSTLVVFQFSISIFLIIGTIVVYRQLGYIQTTNLGFKKENVLIVDGTGALGNSAKAFKEEVQKFAGVTNGAFSGYLPVSPSARNDQTFSREAVMDAKTGFNMQTWWIDADYVSTLGIEIIKGRNFSREFGGDSSGIIINETAAQIIGHADPIGKKIYTTDNLDAATMKAYTIIGVAKNFHYESLRQAIGPLSMRLGDVSFTTAFRVNTADITKLVAKIESKWKQMAPSHPFSYRFLDESFDNMYRQEQRIGRVALTFAILTIFIACLGLFGLATYIAEQRTKEIGVRKVLGASVQNIVQMLSRDFLKLVIIAAVLAFPFGWWIMSMWLRDFVYRVDIGWWIFAVAGIIAVLIAVGTVSYQALKAAIANPVNSLRSE
jgi:putative ABC transport system permease protein